MIHIEDKTQPITLKIIANWAKTASNAYTLQLFNTIEKTTKTINVVDITPNSVLFYTFNTSVDNLSYGEHEYTLVNSDDEVVATGIIEIKDSPVRDIINQNIEYKTYNGNN